MQLIKHAHAHTHTHEHEGRDRGENGRGNRGGSIYKVEGERALEPSKW